MVGVQPKSNYVSKILLLSVLPYIWSCQNKVSNSSLKLEVVTYGQFKEFVEQTNYVTDAEKFGWSIVQENVFNFSKVNGANWKKPDGKNKPISTELPVTQVSFNDALAFCKWSGARLPSYNEYWELIKNDKRKVLYNNNGNIASSKEANILGNVWEITSSSNQDKIRLAGGSLFCSPNTCNGLKKERVVFIDKETANIHIGFAVVK